MLTGSARGFFAELLTDRLLRNGIVAEAVVSGSGKTQLTIFMPAADDVVAYQISHDTDILTTAREAGFKKVILKACHRLDCVDRYIYWTWKL